MTDAFSISPTMTKYLLLLVFGLWLACLPCISQVADTGQVQAVDKASVPAEPNYFLVLDKPGKVSRIRFYTGNKITFKLVNERHRYTGQITQIKKNSFVVWDSEIPIRDVEKIKVIKTGSLTSGFQLLGKFLKNGGLFFSVVGGGNYLLGVEPGENSLTFLKYTAGSFITGWLITRSSRNRTYKINKNHRLRTIEQFW